MQNLPLRDRPSLDDGTIIDVPAPNPVLRYLRDFFTSPYPWGFIVAAFLVKLVVTGAPWQGWLVLGMLIGVALICTRKDGRWRNPYPPADPGWTVRLIMIATYVALVAGLLVWLI